MKLLTTLLTMILTLSIYTTSFAADEIDLQFVVINADGANFEVQIQCKRNNANWDRLGSANFAFYFNNSDLSNPTLQTAHNFSGGNYNDMEVKDNVNWVSVNIDFSGSNGEGTSVPTSSWTNVATIHFDVLNSSGSSNLDWREDGAYSGFDDDETTTLDPGTFTDLNTSPLPVELTGFSSEISGGHVVLNWTTQTESNNFGFDIERSENEINFQKIGFVQGKGTTLIPQHYSFEEKNLAAGHYYYRLKQIDLDGVFEYSEVINVTVEAPKEFGLAQNYPNPFNPETTIRYELPVATHVILVIYNILGEDVRTVVNAEQSVGVKTVIWDGKNNAGEYVGSGLYYYRLVAGDYSRTLKLMLMR